MKVGKKEKILDALEKYRDGKKLNKQQMELVKRTFREEEKEIANNEERKAIDTLINKYEKEIHKEEDNEKNLRKKNNKRKKLQKERLKKIQRNYYEREKDM